MSSNYSLQWRCYPVLREELEFLAHSGHAQQSRIQTAKQRKLVFLMRKNKQKQTTPAKSKKKVSLNSGETTIENNTNMYTLLDQSQTLLLLFLRKTGRVRCIHLPLHQQEQQKTHQKQEPTARNNKIHLLLQHQ